MNNTIKALCIVTLYSSCLAEHTTHTQMHVCNAFLAATPIGYYIMHQHKNACSSYRCSFGSYVRYIGSTIVTIGASSCIGLASSNCQDLSCICSRAIYGATCGVALHYGYKRYVCNEREDYLNEDPHNPIIRYNEPLFQVVQSVYSSM